MKPEIIETIINTTALALTSYGTFEVTTKSNYWGLMAISFGMLLEFIKYYGRKYLW